MPKHLDGVWGIYGDLISPLGLKIAVQAVTLLHEAVVVLNIQVKEDMLDCQYYDMIWTFYFP